MTGVFTAEARSLNLICAARRMGFSLVGFAIHNPNAATVGLPPGNTGSEMLVGVSDALVIFLAILVFVGVGIGIAPPPKLLDKALALIVGLELLEGLPLFIGDDVSDILFQPILVSLIQFRLDVASLLRWILGFFAVLFLREACRNGENEG